MMLLSIGLTITAFILLVISSIFLVECLCGRREMRVPNGRASNATEKHEFIILMPAHNESGIIAETLKDLAQHLVDLSRVVVIADNCDDCTAEISRELGARVVERNDAARRGKGYALAYGVDQIAECPEHVVIILDADCKVEKGALDRLAKEVIRSGGPVQANYKMDAIDRNRLQQRIALYAWRVKNYLRPMGLRRYGLPCQLMGTGMAFPKDLLSKVDLASSNIVEDIQMGLDVAAMGRAPNFLPDAVIYSVLPGSESAAKTQRTRWEHGHLSTIYSVVPAVLAKALRHQNKSLVVMALDLAVPPLTFLAMLISIQLLLSIPLIFFGMLLPVVTSLIAATFFAIALYVSWSAVGRDYIAGGEFVELVKYAISKVAIYKNFFQRKKPTTWVKTER